VLSACHCRRLTPSPASVRSKFSSISLSSRFSQ
jgi:hypothetical protein